MPRVNSPDWLPVTVRDSFLSSVELRCNRGGNDYAVLALQNRRHQKALPTKGVYREDLLLYAGHTLVGETAGIPLNITGDIGDHRIP